MPERNVVEAKPGLVRRMQFLGRISQPGIGIVLDTQPEHGGQSGGFRPTELKLLKKGQDLTWLEIHLKGTRALEHPKRYVATETDFLVRDYEIPEKAMPRSIEFSQTRYCSMSAPLHTKITGSFRIVEEPEA